MPEELLEALVAESPAARNAFEKKRNLVGHDKFDIDEWLLQKSVTITKEPEPYKGGRRWTLPNCPFNPEHKAPVIIEYPSGALAYKCLHTSCSKNDWKALRSLIEPGWSEEAQRSHTATSPNAGVASVTASGSTYDSRRITDLAQLPVCSRWKVASTGASKT